MFLQHADVYKVRVHMCTLSTHVDLSEGSLPGLLLTIWQCSPPPATSIDREMLTLTKFTLKIFHGFVPAAKFLRRLTVTIWTSACMQLNTRCWEGLVSLAVVVNQIHVFTSGVWTCAQTLIH